MIVLWMFLCVCICVCVCFLLWIYVPTYISHDCYMYVLCTYRLCVCIHRCVCVVSGLVMARPSTYIVMARPSTYTHRYTHTQTQRTPTLLVCTMTFLRSWIFYDFPHVLVLFCLMAVSLLAVRSPTFLSGSFRKQLYMIVSPNRILAVLMS